MIDKDCREKILKKARPEIPMGQPGSWYTEQEIEAALSAMEEFVKDPENWYKKSTKPLVKEFERAFAEYVGTEYAVAINGAGSGINMSLMCLDIKPGDEVICPAINYHGDHVAIIGQGAKLVFCEADPRTLNADPVDVEKRVTPKTRAIMVTHMNGLSADMDALLEIAERHSTTSRPIRVIGDAARSCIGEYKGTKIGKKGWMIIFSFHRGKHMTTFGEGGMITTDDPVAASRLRRLRTNSGGGISWGTNWLMTNVQAAVGLVQLHRFEEMINLWRKTAQRRTKFLKGIPELTLPYEPPGYKHTYHLYSILVQRNWMGEKRNRIIDILAEEYNVRSGIANPPTYTYHRYIRENTEGQRLPISEEIGARLFCPTLHGLMTEEQNKYVAAAIIEAVERVRNED